VSRGLTEAMGGTLTPEETPGGGLTMTISLPAVAQATYPRLGQAQDLFLPNERGACLTKDQQQALEVITDRIFPFDQIADAFAYLEQGRAHGKVVVQMV
jgi:NADPH:quinone reductase-like Zn-dependent oxidoreductase